MIESAAENNSFQEKKTEEVQSWPENILRPTSFDEYIGQSDIKTNLKIALQAAQKRKEPLDHLLFHGPPGLGKTTLANVIARESNANLKVTSGPALDKPGDLAAILSNLEKGDILFIDEIHRLKTTIEEVLYTAMEDFAIDLVVGKGPSARSMRINLEHFTLIGATTKLSMLSSPLRDRFGAVYKLRYYNDTELSEVVLRSAKILNVSIGEKEALKLAKSSRKTPRIANRLLKRVRDYGEISEKENIDSQIVDTALKALGVDELGLNETDRNILTVLEQKFHGGPVGLNTLAAATSEEKNTLEDIYEPFLIKLGFLKRTARGRIITDQGRAHLRIAL
jgi:Holliday junction DNA helicase RuvB